MKTKSLSKTRRLLALLAALGSLAVARASDATPMLFTLKGVTFNDGSTASGSFIFDPTNQNYGAFNIATSNSLSNTGSIYSPGTGTGTNFLSSPYTFLFHNFFNHFPFLVLAFSGHIASPGFYALEPGVPG